MTVEEFARGSRLNLLMVVRNKDTESEICEFKSDYVDYIVDSMLQKEISSFSIDGLFAGNATVTLYVPADEEETTEGEDEQQGESEE